MNETLSDAINKYKSRSESNAALLSQIFDTVKYLDVVYATLKRDPVGSVLLNKIESEIAYKFTVAESQNLLSSTKIKFYILFKPESMYGNTYTLVEDDTESGAKSKATLHYGTSWERVTTDLVATSGRSLYVP